ncbi:reverse transcriptase domain-containing protein [Radicibacter daui]|uniref:reverse transcriptase domain-containing protein n=1 Tax=Radicibacter daui TaxID=3064829 RepID=UPI0040468E65
MTNTLEIVSKWEEFFENRAKKKRYLIENYMSYVRKLTTSNLPPIFEINHLSELTGVNSSKIAGMISNTNTFYREFRLPKRRGGFRSISVPSPSLLYTQRWILENILSKMPISPHAHGFISQKSILTNAEQHIGKKFLLKMDIEDFFGTIKIRRGIYEFIKMGYTPNVAYYLSAICFKDGSLPQGAATSPYLSNIISRKIDKRLSAVSSKLDINYTRYADDLSFSSQNPLNGFEKIVEGILISEGFFPNRKKTFISGPTTKKVVTGISISTGAPKIPRETIREIKRDSYFILKFGYIEHQKNTGTFDPLEIDRLLGRVSFWLFVEPNNDTAKKINHDLRGYIKRIASTDDKLEELIIDPIFSED